jgi:phosphoglycerol transferase MdoB-like AlkP superfamily enzyme
MPWAGLALGTFGAGLAHQLGADSTFQDCRLGSPLVVAVGTIVGLVLIALGAAGSWRIYGTEGEGPARRFIAAVSLMACALYAIAVVLPLIAAMVIPRCWE